MVSITAKLMKKQDFYNCLQCFLRSYPQKNLPSIPYDCKAGIMSEELLLFTKQKSRL